MKKSRIIVGGLMLCAFVLSLSSCKSKRETDDAESALVAAQNVENAAAVQVKVEKVFEENVDQEEVYSASVIANTTNNISPKMSLRIEKIFVEVGDRVTKGQILAKMEATSLVQARSQMQNDSIELSRAQQLYEVGGNSKSELDGKTLAYTISKTNYDNLVENTILRSPINGIVTARNYDQGDMFTMAQPLYVVEQITPVKLVVNVSEGLFKDIKKGMTVDVKCDVYADRVFKAKVNLVYPTIDASTRTFPVELVIANTDQAVRPGMFARAYFVYGTAKHVVVPDKAVLKQTGSGDRYVYVVENGKAVFKKVELGRRMGTEYEIISGLHTGDDVVTEGHARLSNGSNVEVVK